MTLRVERIGDRLGVLLTPEQIEELSLREGSPVTVSVPTQEAREARYISLEDGLAAFKRTEPRYAEMYRELAK